MGKIDLDYVEKLFNWMEEAEELTASYKQEKCQFELQEKLGPFLDLVCDCADKKNISEVHKTDGYGLDDRFCYWIRFKNKVIEIGMYYDDIVYVLDQPDNVYPEYVMDCEDIIGFDMKVNKDILFEDFEPMHITEQMRMYVLEHPEKYANCPPRIRMGNFYSDEEWERYVEESLNKPLPGDIKSAKKIGFNWGKKNGNHNK
nr:hypothetical protein [Bacilli bacterium]